MVRKRDDLPRKRREYKKKESEGKNMNAKKCPHCGNNMKYKGPKDTVGTVYWKCRNKQCGRTVNFRREPPKTVIPLVYDRFIWGV